MRTMPTSAVTMSWLSITNKYSTMKKPSSVTAEVADSRCGS